jgi:chromosome segregation ATPase
MTRPNENDALAKIKALQERAKSAADRAADLKSKQDQYRGQLSAKKAELAKVLEEVEAAGLSPKNLRAEVDTRAEELRVLVENFERDLEAVERAFADLEAKQ